MPNNHSSEEEATMNEVLDTINTFANNVYQKFADIDKRFDTMENEMKNRFDALEKRVTRIEMSMVTKDYLDDKLADFRLFNHKLLGVLEGKKVINRFDVQELRQLT